MGQVNLNLDYLDLDTLIEKYIDKPHKLVCQKILKENRVLFEKARGSTSNHQTWVGGYIDHVTDGMNYARHLYSFITAFGRKIPFSLSDALLIFFLHDLEKPWRIIVDEKGEVFNKAGLDSKVAYKKFRENKLKDYGLSLSDYQLNALTYVEGELNDYSSKHRVMNELASFCHIVDNWSARGWYDYPKEINDEWTGAQRFRS